MSWMVLFKKNNYLTLRSKVKVPRRSLRYVTHRLMVMHPHTKYHWPISKDKNVMAWTRKYYLKNNYLTRRSLRYATHCLMVMHPHTKYHWPISKDTHDLNKLRWEEAEEKIRLKQNVSLRSKGRHNYHLELTDINDCCVNDLFLFYWLKHIARVIQIILNMSID
jgi:hypothetical protein